MGLSRIATFASTIALVATAACSSHVVGGGGTGGGSVQSAASTGGTVVTGPAQGTGGSVSTGPAKGTGGSVSTGPAKGTGGGGGAASGCTPQCTVGDTQPPLCCDPPPGCPSDSSSSSSSSSSGGVLQCYCEGTVTPTCVLVGGCAEWQTPDCDTPLVLVFDGAPVDFVVDPEHGFRLSATREAVTDWPSSRTPWLALDRDDNHSIDDGTELFGSMTLVSGGRARDGFEALRALDTDGDGLITERDARFGELQLWSDADGDRLSSANELTSLVSAGIVSIDLRYVSDARCDPRGNCEVERAPFVYRDAHGALRTGEIVDVHLKAHGGTPLETICSRRYGSASSGT